MTHPFVVTTYSFALHTWDCDTVLHRKPEESKLLTVEEARAWLNDPPYTIPSFHKPRKTCGKCLPDVTQPN